MDAVRYKASSQRGPSELLWKGFDFSAIASDPSAGIHIFEDFTNFPNKAGAASNVTGYHGGHNYFSEAGSSAGGSVAQSTTLQGGVIVVTGSDTDDDNWAIQRDGASVLIASTSLKRVAFEGRMRVSTITDSKNSFFLGMLESNAIAANVPILDDTSASTFLSDNNLIGFWRQEGSSLGNIIKFSFKADGQTMNTTTISSSFAALAADTWIKLGFIVDFYEDPSKRLKIFVDGTEYTTTYITGSVVAGATFPSDVCLCPCISVKPIANATAGTASFDWYRLAAQFQ